MSIKLRMTEAQHAELRLHLFPGDGLEAVSLLLCGRASHNGDVLTVHQIVNVPYSRCRIRRLDLVSWDASILDEHIGQIWRLGLSIVKVHSHPTDYRAFSETDNDSDYSLAGSWELMFPDIPFHGSAIMVPNGLMFGRSLSSGSIGESFSSVSVVGQEIWFWQHGTYEIDDPQVRTAQTFGNGTVSTLRAMKAGVVGASGTGSIVIEQLARLGIGSLVLVDPDVVEPKNLNRILNSTSEHASNRAPKVLVQKEHIVRLGFEQSIEPIQSNLDYPEAVRALSTCDVVFGCVDSAEGRALLNRLAAFYSLPYFDVGVGLDADGSGGISTISGAVNYYFPGSTPLQDRGAFSGETARAEAMKRANPDGYELLRKEGYIRGVAADRPAVIGVNMVAASLLVHEFLCRVHIVRNFGGDNCETLRIDLCEMALIREQFRGESDYLINMIGRGDCKPLLDRPSLSESAA